MSLSAKHEAFCIEYVQTWNASDAYSRVYKKATRESCYTNGSILLRNPKIQERIKEYLRTKQMTADEVLTRLADQARATHEPFVRITSEGFIYFDFSNPEALKHLHLIKKVKTKRTRRVEGKGEDAEQWEDEWMEVELHDAQAALQLIGKHHKLFNDKVEVEHKLNVEGLQEVLSKVYGNGTANNTSDS